MAGKSILVVDTPKNCPECQLMADGWCYGKHYADVYEELEKDKRPSWCPLKPLPKKKNTDFHPNVVYANGWNDCLKEIANESSDR